MFLKEVCIENVWEIVKLEVHDEQKSFVATNTQSILEAYCTKQRGAVALPYGIYDNEDGLIGFVMLGYGFEEGDPIFVKDCYCLWRFMIDKKFQGKGYGKKALQCVIDYIYEHKPCGTTTSIWLSYEADNMVAKHLYASFNFVENGEIIDGEIVAIKE